MTESPERLKAALVDRYRIERELGAGGMATVYLAADLKHDRRVAIKVLRPELAAVLGAERFVQEIKTTASLQHPHILPLHDSGEADGFLYYVMPYIEGDTLRDKLNRETQLGIDEAVKIATEVADALDYAHRQNVIHRDIKPENILLHDGRPMVADFGIALAVSAAAGGRMTETGLSLGTPHYMSPEQATADKDLTNRSDIYSLGAMLYEMLTGSPPHVGSSAQQIIMKIVTEEAAPVTDARKSVPPNVAAAVAKALEKLPADRFATAQRFAQALHDPSFAVDPLIKRSSHPFAGSWRNGPVRFTAMVALLTGVIALIGWLRPSRFAPPSVGGAASVLEGKFVVGTGVATSLGLLVGISRDGRWIAFSGKDETGQRRLFVRSRDALAASAVTGTEEGTSPFFSPDNEWLGFTRAGRIDRVRLGGGQPQTIVPSPLAASNGTAFWGDDGMVYFTIIGSPAGLARVPAAGGEIERLTNSDGVEAASPWLTEAGELLFAQWNVVMVASRLRQNGDVDLLSDFETWTPSLIGGNTLVFGRSDGSILAANYDPDAGVIGSSTVMIVQGVEVSSNYPQFAISHTGDLVYMPDEGDYLEIIGPEEARLITEDRRDFQEPSISPDGRRVISSAREGEARALWVYDVEDGRRERVAEGSAAFAPVWVSPSEIIYGVWGGGIARRNAQRVGPTTYIVTGEGHYFPFGWSPDGRLVYNNWGVTQKTLVLNLETREEEALPGEHQRFAVTYSSDGALVAEVTLEMDRWAVFVATADYSQRALVSPDGGAHPMWAPGGDTLYYVRLGDAGQVPALVRAVVNRSDLTSSKEIVGPWPDQNADPHFRPSIHPDGIRFVRVRPSVERQVVLVENWLARVREQLNATRQ